MHLFLLGVSHRTAPVDLRERLDFSSRDVGAAVEALAARSSAAESVVVFEREVAKKMVCHALVNFSLKDDELRSAPIRAGEFASFCQLAPGRYRYKVVRPAALERTDARRTLDGEILVEEPAG